MLSILTVTACRAGKWIQPASGLQEVPVSEPSLTDWLSVSFSVTIARDRTILQSDALASLAAEFAL